MNLTRSNAARAVRAAWAAFVAWQGARERVPVSLARAARAVRAARAACAAWQGAGVRVGAAVIAATAVGVGITWQPLTMLAIGIGLFSLGAIAARSATSEPKSDEPQRLYLIRPPWWLHPSSIATACGGTALGLTILVSANDYERWWSTPKYFTTGDALLAFVYLAAFVGGCALALPRTRAERLIGHDTSLPVELWRIARFLLWLTLSGYVAWVLVAIGRGLQLHQVFAVLAGHGGVVFHLKATTLRPVTGVTTLTQFGPPAVAALAVCGRLGERRAKWGVLLLVVLAALRSALHSEREALTEVALPWLAVQLFFVRVRPGQPVRGTWMRVLAPLAIPVAVVGLFAALEYGRSWTHYRTQPEDRSYVTFVERRMAAYYATSNNNSVILLNHDDRTLHLPLFSIDWFWRFPGINRVVDYDSVTSATALSPDLVSTYGNPEFTNPGALLPMAYDYGRYGAFLAWLLVGSICGWLYRRASDGNLIAVIAYATIIPGLFEIGRFFYWGSGRAFPALVGAALVAYTCRDSATVAELDVLESSPAATQLDAPVPA